MTIENLVEEALKLTPAEQERLMDRLADRLAEANGAPLGDLWNQEIRRRVARYESGEDQALSWEQAREVMVGARR